MTPRQPRVAQLILSSGPYEELKQFFVASSLMPSIRQALLVAVIIGSTCGLAWFGLGSAVRILFMSFAVVAGWYYHRQSPWLYLTVTFWFWTLTPFIRRIIDYRVGFDALNVVLVTPNLMTLFMLPSLLHSHTLLRHREALFGLLLLVPALYGLAVSFLQGQLLVGAIGAADWIMPLLYLFYLIENFHSLDEAEPHLCGFITLNTLFVVGYGLNQFFNPPVWDIEWAKLSGHLGLTDVTAGSFHVFGTLNDPGVLAEWLGALILLSLNFRTRLTTLLLPAASATLLLTLVRSVTVGVFIGLAMSILLGGIRMVSGLARFAVAIVIVGIFITMLDSTSADGLIARFSSIGDLQGDYSANERLSIWSSAPALIDAHPLGMGIGALGRGAAAAGNADLISIDAGPLAIYLSLGWIAGTIYLIGMLTVVGQALSVAYRLKRPEAIVFAAAATCSFSELPFVNIYGFPGSVLWVCGGFAIAYGIRARIAPLHNVLAMQGGIGPSLAPKILDVSSRIR